MTSVGDTVINFAVLSASLETVIISLVVLISIWAKLNGVNHLVFVPSLPRGLT